MRTRCTALLVTFFFMGLLLPWGASAKTKTETILGSLTITGATAAQLVGVVVDHNPGFEKTITLHIPPFTAPIFLDEDKEEDMGGQVVNSRFDTTVVLTNTTTDSLAIMLTVRDASGMVLATTTKTLGANATIMINLSTLVP